ncbi:hypothetical protein DNTS_003536 [Danionella cerebrum]|uniref:Peptidase S74 domain-containing protein n=1 Tax=Danionella cerebrum TaxID=2873325 RepID=A0A553QXG8_9TELE|nr:hypothetical protein DNTS_003536 [Danionella translucida]
MDVLGENEALQQFFNGQDVSGVLESTAVDTSILEQYLSNETDPTFMLPESPPDSGSERSPQPQIQVSIWSREQRRQNSGNSFLLPCPYTDRKLVQCGNLALMSDVGRPVESQIKAMSPALDPQYNLNPNTQPAISHNVTFPGLSHYPPYPPVSFSVGHKAAEASICTPNVTSPITLPPKQDPHVGLHEHMKRRRSNSFESYSELTDQVRNKPCAESSSFEAHSSDSGSPQCGVHQQLSWDHYHQSQWCSLHNSKAETLPPPGYHVETDKGFSFSPVDEAFVCQKKNHFQVTVHIGMLGDPRFIQTPTGLMPVESFYLNLFGLKLEAQNHFITIEQSQSDRSKKPFLPVRVNLPGDKITKVTLGRLHFSETTANNMRKKGKPNPDQRYFLMAVGLYAKVKEDSFLLVANVSERIIVRASNPGLFESEGDALWQRGLIPDSIVYHGRVGINTDSPDEALVVCGNTKIMGNVMHPSDRRAKENIQEVDSTEQLKRISQMRIVEYDYKPEFASKMGIDQRHETGIIAQEVRDLLPSAVREMGDITCINGQTIDQFLMVDKEQIFMENVGAVKQLCKLTDNLESRIQELEVWNSRLARLKRLGSRSSISSPPDKRNSCKNNTSCPELPTALPPSLASSKNYLCVRYHNCLQHRVFQASIIMLVTTMALCVISITALYMLTLREDLDFSNSLNNSNAIPSYTTPAAHTTEISTDPPAPWPPDIDFSNVFYSDEIYCCPSQSLYNQNFSTNKGSMLNFLSDVFTNLRKSLQEIWLETLPEKLINSSDWTNTTIQSIFITQNQQVINRHYCQENCRTGNYTYFIPLNKHTPPNMPITLQMKSKLGTKQVLYDVEYCGEGYIHKWTLAVANHHRASYHFRTSVAGMADCSTDRNFAGVLFTDYHFQFFRRCD